MATDSASSTTHRRDAERPEGGAGIGGEEGEMKRIARDVGPGEKPGRQEEDQSQQETGMEKNVASQEEEREQQELGLEAAGQKKGLRFWLIFISLLLATFEAALEQTAISTALPTIAEDLGIVESSWVANAFMICSAAFIPWSGGLASIFGRRPVMVAGLSLFFIGSLICALAQETNAMLAGRGIQGAGAGIIFAIVEILLSDLVPLAERGTYQGAFSATWSVASALGPIVGGAFASYNWRWLFWLNIAITPPLILSSFFCIKLKTPEGSMREKMKKMDWIGNFIFIPSISILILGLVSGGASHPWKSTFVIATLVAGVLGLVVWVLYEHRLEKRDQNPTVPFGALLNRTTTVGYLTTWLHGVVAMVLLYYWPAFFQAAKASTVIASAVNFLPVVCFISPAAMATGLTINRFQHYKLQNIVGWVLLAVGVGVLVLTNENTSKAGWVLLPIISSLGVGILYACPVFAVLAPLPPALAGVSLSTQMLIRTFGNVLGISIGSTALSNVLATKLPTEFLEMLPNGVAGAYAAIPSIRGLEEPLKGEVQTAFAQALRVVWLVMIPFAVIGLVVSFFMRSIPLNAKVDETYGVKQKKSDALDSAESARSSINEGASQ